MQFSTSALSEGQRIHGYEVVAALGTAGIAERFRARKEDGTERFLGVVGAHHPDLISTLVARGLERLQHPNVLTVEQVLEVMKMPLLVTPTFDGAPLRDRLLLSEGTPEQRLAMFRQVVSAVGAGHALGLVHGDLRPETIVFHGGAPKVLDFGVVWTIIGLTSGLRSISTTGLTMGEPAYWAPERAKHPGRIDARADIFSLGCILYELYVGHSPFVGLTSFDVYFATKDERYEAMPLGSAPDAVLALIPHLLRGDPDKRPKTCDEILFQLDASNSGRWPAITPRPSPVVEPARVPTHAPPPTTRLTPVAVAVIIGAVLVGVAIGLLFAMT